MECKVRRLTSARLTISLDDTSLSRAAWGHIALVAAERLDHGPSGCPGAHKARKGQCDVMSDCYALALAEPGVFRLASRAECAAGEESRRSESPPVHSSLSCSARCDHRVRNQKSQPTDRLSIRILLCRARVAPRPQSSNARGSDHVGRPVQQPRNTKVEYA